VEAEGSDSMLADARRREKMTPWILMNDGQGGRNSKRQRRRRTWPSFGVRRSVEEGGPGRKRVVDWSWGRAVKSINFAIAASTCS
jgi:hypothetical protein